MVVMLAAVQKLLAHTAGFSMRDADLTLHGAYVPASAPTSSPHPQATHRPPTKARTFAVAFDAVRLLDAVPLLAKDWADTAHERACLVFLSGVLLTHARNFLQLMGGSGAAGESAAAGSHRVNFVVWGALSLYRAFLEENDAQLYRAPSQMPQRLGALRLWFDEFCARRDAHVRCPGAPHPPPRPLFDVLHSDEAMRDAYCAFLGPDEHTLDAMSACDSTFVEWFLAVADPVFQSIADSGSVPLPRRSTELGCAGSSGAAGAWLAAQTTTAALLPQLTLAARVLAQADDEQDAANRSSGSSARETLLTSLSFALEALQIVPTLNLDADGESQAQLGRLGGYWHPTRAVAATAHGVRGACYRSKHALRWFVDVPGLSMAATVVESAAVDGNVGNPSAPSPSTSTTPSTLLFVPPLAEWASTAEGLFMHEALLHANRVRADPARPSPFLNDDGLCAHIPAAALRPVTLLLLFSTLPAASLATEEEDIEEGLLSLADLHAFICAATRCDVPDAAQSGKTESPLVVVVVQSDVDKRTACAVEAWRMPRTASAPRVIVVSSVGEWTMTQLCLRFQVQPNSPYTSPASLLRCVWDTAGLLLTALDWCQKPHAAAQAQQPFTEQWTRYLVVVGGAVGADSDLDRPVLGQPSTTHDDHHHSSRSDDGMDDAQGDSHRFSRMRPFSSSSSGETSSEAASSVTSCGEEGGEVQDAMRTEQAQGISANRVGRAREVVPVCGCVMRSVWLGGNTDLAQLESYHYLQLFRRRRVREEILPRSAGVCVPAALDDNVELRLLAALDGHATAPRPLSDTSHGAGSLDSVSLLKQRLEAHLRQMLRTLLLSQYTTAGDEPHVAWDRLSRLVRTLQEDATTPSHPESNGVSTELLLDVRYAYVVMLQCASELCRTVLVDGIHSALNEDAACHVLS